MGSMAHIPCIDFEILSMAHNKEIWHNSHSLGSFLGNAKDLYHQQ